MIRVHPLGIRPSGNALLNVEYSRIKFMGSLGYLPDELIMVVLQELCPADLIAVGCACKALYAFASFDELWKHIVHSYSEPPKRWLGTWKNTALGFKSPTIDCSNRVFSDFLYRPFELSQVNYSSMLQELDSHTIKKYAEREVTEDVFNESLHEKPFIVELEGAVANWTISGLVEEFGDETFRQEYMNWPLRVYQEYMSDNCDETPLYLFDCDSRAHEKLDGQLRKPLPEVWGPKHDLFSLFGSARPDHQWLILGPQRSGSTFHKDPNGTSAWNSLISGKKYWLFFPPSQNPPGVWTDADQSEVTAPVSLAEWFSCGFYKEALHTPGVLHAITEPGHCMYVPTGWWHAVVNLSDTIAMTGNFVPRAQFLRVAEFLRSKPDQISGFRDPDGIYKQFMDLVNDNHPSLASQIKHDERKRRWTEVVKSDKLFTFGFS